MSCKRPVILFFSWRFLVAGGVGVLLTAAPVWAQNTPLTQNYATMFLITDDLIGNLITWLLVLMSIFSSGYSLRLLMRYRRRYLIPQRLVKRMHQFLVEDRFAEAIEYAEKHPSYLAYLLRAALREAPGGYGAMTRALEETSDLETTRILRPIEYLNVLGNIAPMIGLFGTVYGMIVAFQTLVASGGSPDPAELAGGISTALITTFWGLLVAIPALGAYALIRNRVDEITTEGLLVADELIERFKPAARRLAAEPAEVQEDQP